MANPFTNYLIKNVLSNYISKENWLLNSCDLNLLDYAIWDIMKKKHHKNEGIKDKRHEDIEELSAAMSDAWDRLTKRFINNSIHQ